MKLIIDIGNTNIKLAVFEKKNIIKKYIYKSIQEIDLSPILSRFYKIKYILFCGQNKSLNKHLNNIINDKSVKIFYWDNISKFMIDIEYDKIDSLGYDRIGGSIGALFTFPNFKNHLIIDIGTCITYDIVSNKIYKGGQISPGINLRLKSLSGVNSKLPNLKFQEPYKFLGKSTFESIQSGVFFGIYDEIISRILYYNNKFKNLNTVITGGDSVFFKKRIKNVNFDNDILMKGLNLLLEHNVK